MTKELKKITKNILFKKLRLAKFGFNFLSLPNGEAQKIIKKNFYKYKKLKFIDLSADFRLKDKTSYEKTYKLKHKASDLINKSLYSIPEFSKKEIYNYRIISNPGCYSTSIQIPLIPIINKKLININNITIDSKSGFSGAGKNLEKKFPHKNLYSSTFAYKTKNHRHIIEMDQQFAKFTKKNQFFF